MSPVSDRIGSIVVPRIADFLVLFLVFSFITSDKGRGKCVCLSVCLLARLLKNACMDLDEMLRVNRCRDPDMDKLINF